MNEQLPNSKEAEQAVIGSVLLYPAAYYEAAKYINYTDFYIVRNQWIWQAFDHLIRTHVDIDILTVTSRLESQNNDVGQNYLLEIINNTPTAMHAEHYAIEVSKFSSRRSIRVPTGTVDGIDSKRIRPDRLIS